MRKWNFALEMPLLLGTALSKISISLLLLRLLGKASSRTQKIILHSINFFVAAYTFIDIINNVIACKPTAKLWNFDLPGKCRSTSSIIAITYFQGGWKPCYSCQVYEHIADVETACSAFVAVMLSSLPIIIFRNLQMNQRTKLAVCLLMGLGVL